MTVRQGQRRIARQKPRGTARHSAALNCAETWTTENCWDKDRLSGSTKNRNGRGRAVTVSTRSRRRRSDRFESRRRRGHCNWQLSQKYCRESYGDRQTAAVGHRSTAREEVRELYSEFYVWSSSLTARPNQLRQRQDPVLLISEWPEGKPAELWATC